MDPITRGDTRRIRITATYPEDAPGISAGDPFPLSSHTTRFTARRKVTDPLAVFSKSTEVGGGITILPAGNVAEIALSPSDTSGLQLRNPVTLVCDLEVSTASGDVWTVWQGELTVKPDVTHTP